MQCRGFIETLNAWIAKQKLTSSTSLVENESILRQRVVQHNVYRQYD